MGNADAEAAAHAQGLRFDFGMMDWLSLSVSDTQPILPRCVPLVTMMRCQPLFVGSLASLTSTCVLISRSNPSLALDFAGSTTTCVFFVVYFTSTVDKRSAQGVGRTGPAGADAHRRHRDSRYASGARGRTTAAAQADRCGPIGEGDCRLAAKRSSGCARPRANLGGGPTDTFVPLCGVTASCLLPPITSMGRLPCLCEPSASSPLH